MLLSDGWIKEASGHACVCVGVGSAGNGFIQYAKPEEGVWVHTDTPCAETRWTPSSACGCSCVTEIKKPGDVLKLNNCISMASLIGHYLCHLLCFFLENPFMSLPKLCWRWFVAFCNGNGLPLEHLDKLLPRPADLRDTRMAAALDGLKLSSSQTQVAGGIMNAGSCPISIWDSWGRTYVDPQGRICRSASVHGAITATLHAGTCPVNGKQDFEVTARQSPNATFWVAGWGFHKSQ